MREVRDREPGIRGVPVGSTAILLTAEVAALAARVLRHRLASAAAR